MLGFILLLFIFFGIWVSMISMADVQEVKKNWPKYRCRPNIMPFASLYGHNTGENFTFCLMNMFGEEMGTALGPVFTILASMVATLATLVQVANSMRLQFATMMGGVNTIFQNFTDRFKQLVFTIQMSAYRMKLIMGRLYGAFFAMIYMSVAGIAAVDNFTKTSLFNFLDTFCFDPDTLVDIEGRGLTKVKDVKMGNVFTKTGGRVTSLLQFEADGQPMVELPGNILVSTNHYVNYLGNWIHAGDHPMAIQKGPWQGGKERPLICFNTSDHKIPVGHFTFLDYDETEEGDEETMSWIEQKVNGRASLKQRTYDYTTCVDRETEIRMKDGSVKQIQNIQLGDILSTGEVVGIIKKQTKQYCELPTREYVAPGLLYWQTKEWVRAGDVHPILSLNNSQPFYSLVVLNNATYETKRGTFMRDYVEVHSPDSEQVYAKKIESLPSCVLAE